jgi:hypothetical protein
MNTNTSKIKVEIIHSINKYGCQKSTKICENRKNKNLSKIYIKKKTK